MFQGVYVSNWSFVRLLSGKDASQSVLYIFGHDYNQLNLIQISSLIISLSLDSYILF